MNFDFSEKEKRFLAQVSDTIAAFAKKRDLESNDLSMIKNHLTDTLAVLAPLDYLRIGLIKEGAPLSGSLALMAVMEQLSGIAPSIFLSVEMSTRLFGRILTGKE